MEISRVLELFDTVRKEGGSGYLLSDRLILTAAHVVGKPGDACQWRPATSTPSTSGSMAWRSAVVLWVGDGMDAALLGPPGGESFAAGLKSVILGFPSGRTTVTADATGFPTAIDIGTHSDVFHAEGNVDPFTGSRMMSPIFGVTTPAPSKPTGWKGMSGAAVFAGDILIGIIEEVPGTLSVTSLRIVPALKIVSSEEAAALLLGAGISSNLIPVTPDDVASAKRRSGWPELRVQYAQAVVNQYCQLDYAGLPGDRGSVTRPALEGFRDMRFASEEMAEAGEIRIEGLSTQSHFVIIGEPGSGKSTALKQALALAAKNDAACVPIWLAASSLPPGKVTLPALIQHLSEVAMDIGMPRADADFFRAAADDKKIVIAFDALDEVHESRRPAVRDLVETIAREWKGCRVWLSSRPGQYWKTPLGQTRPRPAELPQIFKVWRVRPINKDMIAQFLQLCFDDDGQLARMFLSRPDLAAILETPQTLSMLARVAQAQGSLPASRAQIYAQWIDVVCSTWEDTKGKISEPGEVADRKKGLQLIAWNVQDDDHASPFKMKQAQRAVAPLFGLRGEAGAEGLIKWLIERSGVLDWVDESGRDTTARLIRFRHLQFQEYLAAVEFESRWSSERETVRDFMRTRWWRDDWFELLRFAAALLAEESTELLNEILMSPDPYEESLRRGVLLTASLMSDFDRIDRKLAVEVVRRLEAAAVEVPYLYADVCELLIGNARHEPVLQALDGVASGRLLARVIENNGGTEEQIGTRDELMRGRLRATEVVAQLRGNAYALRLVEQHFPHPDPLEDRYDLPLQNLLDVLVLRYHLGDREKAKSGFEVLIHGRTSTTERRDILERLDAISESTFADVLISDVLQRNPASVDLPLAVWCFRRGVSAANVELVKMKLLDATSLIQTVGANLHPSKEVTSVIEAAADLWRTHPLPEVHTLFESVLGYPGLVWFWAYRVRQLVPDLASKAVEVMVKLATDRNLFDNSRRLGMVSVLCNDPDDRLVVPALFRMLESEPTLRWGGEMIVDSLRARGHDDEMLKAFRKLAVPSDDSQDKSARALELAERLKPGVTEAWLDEIWRSSGNPTLDAERLESNWNRSGVTRFVRGWFAKLARTDEGRAFLDAARCNPRDTLLTDEARHALSGRVIESFGGDDDEPAEKTVPTFGALESRLSTLLAEGRASIRDITDVLEEMVNIDRREDALKYAAQWVNGLDPAEPLTALELLNRLQYLSWSDIWIPEWTNLLARVIQMRPVSERGGWMDLLRAHA